MTEKISYKEWYLLHFHNGMGVNGVLDENSKPHEDYIPLLRKMYLGLDRFIMAQDRYNTYQQALSEVKSGKKTTHWIWFIFPQLGNYNLRGIADYYALSRDDAEEYLKHPILGLRLIEITEAVYNNEKSVYEIFGHDAIKVRNCMKLFASVSNAPIFKKMINKYCWK